MSLLVEDREIAMAQVGTLTDGDFVEIIRRSLPRAYVRVQSLVQSLGDQDMAVAAPPHMPDQDRGELLRMFASTAMRQALEKHFGVGGLAFQNCHYIAVANPAGLTSQSWQRFVSMEAQVLAQRPELRDC